MNEDEWTPLIETNLIGTFRTTKSVLPIMMEKKAGNIVNISSLLGMRAIPGVPLSVYGVTKRGCDNVYKEYSGRIRPIRNTLQLHSTVYDPHQSIEPYLEDEEARTYA